MTLSSFSHPAVLVCFLILLFGDTNSVDPHVLTTRQLSCSTLDTYLSNTVYYSNSILILRKGYGRYSTLGFLLKYMRILCIKLSALLCKFAIFLSIRKIHLKCGARNKCEFATSHFGCSCFYNVASEQNEQPPLTISSLR
jgi:hypothetical protein